MSELISILGAGESGVGSAILAQKQGFDVWVSDYNHIQSKYKAELDQYGIKYEENGHDETYIKSSTKIIKSPGISDEAPIVLAAISANIPVISEIEFAASYTDASLIGITGTNGKTTTTLLTYSILKNAGLLVGLAGNVGYSFARQVALENYEYYVLELSSFQLDGMHTVTLDYAVLLNISPDHLYRYATYQDYIDSKLRINLNQDSNQKFIFCADDDEITNQLKNHTTTADLIPFTYDNGPLDQGAWVENNQLNIQLTNPKINFNMSLDQLTIAGRHNTYN